MKKHFTIIAIALLLCLGLQSKERTQEQKRQLALSALKASTQTRAATADNIKELRTMDALTIMGYTDGGGFAIISNDDRHEAVLGWSDGRFNADKLPDGLEWWLNTANAVLESGNAYVRTITPATVGNGSLPESVDNFIAAKWGQGEPYNLQCPAVVTTRTLTGCVATAAAQIMYYYGYPTSGTGTEFDNMTLDKIDFANTNYDYGNMLPDYSQGYTNEQANAVATLMHHCGVATQMSYGTDASGAYSHVAAGAWRDHFKYSTEFYMREAYPQREWMNIIYSSSG